MSRVQSGNPGCPQRERPRSPYTPQELLRRYPWKITNHQDGLLDRHYRVRVVIPSTTRQGAMIMGFQRVDRRWQLFSHWFGSCQLPVIKVRQYEEEWRIRQRRSRTLRSYQRSTSDRNTAGNSCTLSSQQDWDPAWMRSPKFMKRYSPRRTSRCSGSG
jgi:hypothetical protein